MAISVHRRIAEELGVRERQVASAVELLDGGVGHSPRRRSAQHEGLHPVLVEICRRRPEGDFQGIVIGIEGGGFLWNQIRIMVGTLVEIGMGKYPPERILEMLAARDRRAAGPTAPPEGLYLQWIKF